MTAQAVLPGCSFVMTLFQSRMQLSPEEQKEGEDRPGTVPDEGAKAGDSSRVIASQQPACPESEVSLCPALLCPSPRPLYFS